MTQTSFPWYILRDVTYYDPNLTTISNRFGFSHAFFNKGEVVSNYFSLCTPLIDQIEAKFSVPVNELIRVRGGLYTNIGFPLEHFPHVDLDEEHKVVLFYVCGDGPTTIYQTKYTNLYKNITITEPAEIEQMQSNSLKLQTADNSAVLFNGLNFHNSSSPSNSMVRIVISINFR